MKTLCLMLARFCLSAWVGAASLFVVTGVAEVRHPDFDSATRDELAKIRFPRYYEFGFGLVGLGLILGMAARRHPALGRRRGIAFLGLTAAALLVMIADYLWIYSPLAAMLLQEARPANFHDYHNASMWINTASLSLALISALLVCWSGRRVGEA
jgi:hypothetical protein